MDEVDSRDPEQDSAEANRISAAFLRSVIALWQQEGQQIRRVPAVGSSMLPLIAEGDLLLVAPGTRDIRVGDVIVFHTEEGLIAHRVLRIRRRQDRWIWLTKGDNALAPDPPVRGEQILGRVVGIVRPDGRCIRLDSRTWRCLGWVLSALSWSSGGIYRLTMGARRSPLGRWVDPVLGLGQGVWKQRLLRLRQRLIRAVDRGSSQETGS